MANPTTSDFALRLAVGVVSCAVSGIGFLGAGSVCGLDTAATRRCSAAAGRPGPYLCVRPSQRGLPVRRDGEDTSAVHARARRSGRPRLRFAVRARLRRTAHARVGRGGDLARRLERLIVRLFPESGVRDLYRHPDHGSLGTEGKATAA
ncbi:hypothetical protein [Streptomyces sp. NPDC001508]|uniref:hypothetical protein n=1 Tax=Streptomyces sp. NPDC001508 TaxID=3154656 RepID=UPI003328B3D1